MSERRRLWILPPPAQLESWVPYDGHELLRELHQKRLPDTLALYLWQLLRNARLFADAGPSERPALFPGDAAVRLCHLHERAKQASPALFPPSGALETLARLAVLTRRPGPDPERKVAYALVTIAMWADKTDLLWTAALFAQTAALVHPLDTSAAYLTGRLARNLARYEAALEWYRRARGIARRSHDWNQYALAWAGIGNVYVRRGNIPRAIQAFRKCLRATRRYGLPEIRGMAMHDMFGLLVEQRRYNDAVRAAKEAFRLYSRTHHPRLPALVHDIALYWQRRGHSRRALPVLYALLPHLKRPENVLLCWSSIALAAAEAADRETYHQAWTACWEIIDAPGSTEENHAAAAINLALGAARLRDNARLSVAASFAHAVAERRREAEYLIQAEEIARKGTRTSVPGPAPEESEEATAWDSLADQAVHRLRSMEFGRAVL
jgi:tetratricopeptide (TPR) repeat protein